MEAGNPAPAGVSTLPRSSLATRSRKPRIRRVFPDQGDRWIGWKEEAPHPRGLSISARSHGGGKPLIRRRFSNPRNIQILNSKEAPQPAVFFLNRLSRSVRVFGKPHTCKGSPYLLAKPFSVFLLMDSTGSPPYLLTKRSRP